MNIPTVDPRSRVFTPSEFAESGCNYLKWRENMQPFAVQSGIPRLDELLLPLLPPEFLIVQALSSHGKTQFLNFVARHRARYLQEHMQQNAALRNHKVVLVSWEQTIEEMFA